LSTVSDLIAQEIECIQRFASARCRALHGPMSTGVSFGEQLVYDIERLKRHFPAVPVKVMLVDVDLPVAP